MDANQVRSAVEELLRRGETPSVRKIRALIGGGSMRDVARLFAEIKAQDGAALIDDNALEASVAADGNALGLGDMRSLEVPSASQHEAQEQIVDDPTRAGDTPPHKVYYCSRYPELRIRHLKFEEGQLETDDPREQALVEGSSLFGLEIFISSEF